MIRAEPNLGNLADSVFEGLSGCVAVKSPGHNQHIRLPAIKLYSLAPGLVYRDSNRQRTMTRRLFPMTSYAGVGRRSLRRLACCRSDPPATPTREYTVLRSGIG
jgi:hypothetical protein